MGPRDGVERVEPLSHVLERLQLDLGQRGRVRPGVTRSRCARARQPRAASRAHDPLGVDQREFEHRRVLRWQRRQVRARRREDDVELRRIVLRAVGEVPSRAQVQEGIGRLERTIAGEEHQVVERLVDAVQLQPCAHARRGDRRRRGLRFRFAPRELGLVQLPHARVARRDIQSGS